MLFNIFTFIKRVFFRIPTIILDEGLTRNESYCIVADFWVNNVIIQIGRRGLSQIFVGGCIGLLIMSADIEQWKFGMG
jgi:hypothetical protein